MGSRGLAQSAAAAARRMPAAAADVAPIPWPSDYGAARARVHRQSSRWRPPAARTDLTTLRGSQSTAAPSIHTHPAFSTAPSTAAAASDPSRHTRTLSSEARPRLLISYHDLELALERRGLNAFRVVVAAAAAVAAVVGLAWPRIKKWGALETAEVAAATLQQHDLQMQAVSTLRDVLTDPQTGHHVERLLKDAVVNLFHDEEFTEKTVEWTAGVFADALQRPNVIERGSEYFGKVLYDDDSIAAAEEFLSEAVTKVVSDERMQDRVASGLWSGMRASVVGRRRPRRAVEEADASTNPAAAAAAATTTAADTTAEAAHTAAKQAVPGGAAPGVAAASTVGQDDSGEAFSSQEPEAVASEAAAAVRAGDAPSAEPRGDGARPHAATGSGALGVATGDGAK